jgi:NTE family protein
MSFALVLAGGGVAGIAWEIGVLRGLQDAGVDVLGASVIVGTSAGATVAAQITGGATLGELVDQQLSESTTEIDPGVDMAALSELFAEAVGNASSPLDARKRMGALALAAETVPESVRRAVIAARLPSPQWPVIPIVLSSVDAKSGEVVAFTKDSGVDLVDAVAASCAVPGVWPPTTINGRRYIDGGVASGTHVPLAGSVDHLLVLTPLGTDGPLGASLDDELAALDPKANALILGPDEATIEAIGGDPLNPATRGPSVRAGLDVGRDAASQVARFLA